MDEITTVKNKVKFAGWISMVEECQNSGLSIRTWCKENNVCYKTYLYRLRTRTLKGDHSRDNTAFYSSDVIISTAVVTPQLFCF